MLSEYHLKHLSDRNISFSSSHLLHNSQRRESGLKLQQYYQTLPICVTVQLKSIVVIEPYNNAIARNEIVKSSHKVNRNRSASALVNHSKLGGRGGIINEKDPQVENVISINKKSLIDYIITSRKKAAEMIITSVKSFYLKCQIRKRIMIEYIRKMRDGCAILIQKNIRRFFVYKQIQSVREHDLLFFYSLGDTTFSSKTSLKMLIRQKKNQRTELSFVYSKYLRCYYLPFKKTGVMKKQLKVNFLVDGNVIIDPCYAVWNDEKGQFYNILETSKFHKKLRHFPKHVEYHSSILKVANNNNNNQSNQIKFWEKIFEIKSRPRLNSIENCSSASEASIENYMNIISTNAIQGEQKEIQLKSILKNKIVVDEEQQLIKRNNNNNRERNQVTFNLNIEYSY